MRSKVGMVKNRRKTMGTIKAKSSSIYIETPAFNQDPYLQADLPELLSVYQTLNPDDSV